MLEQDETKQVSFYIPGVGTMGEVDYISFYQRFVRAVRYVAENGFGYGVFRNVKLAYTFLMNNFEPGDKVFIYGFSRGAYTAKVFCSALHQFGLLRQGNEQLIEHAISLLKNVSKDNWVVSKKFKKQFSRECKPHFVGLWDAVSSVGHIHNPVMVPYTFENPGIAISRHAIAIDERRAFFPAHTSKLDSPSQDAKEVYFAGVHSDVGGWPKESESQLSKIALEWMVTESELAGLLLDQKRKVRVLGGSGDYVKPDAKGPIHSSLTIPWWIAEFTPKKVWNPKKSQLSWRVNLFRPRSIPENVLLHPSVVQRMDSKELNYCPKNLPSNHNTWDPKFHSVVPTQIFEATPELAPRDNPEISLR